MGQLGIPELFIVLAILCTGLVVVWPAARICSRLGFSPWLGILAVVPVANLFLLWFVAVTPWPRPPLSQGGA